MTTIYFTKTFTSGLLKGISVVSNRSFPTVQKCADFAKIGRKGKDIITKDQWVITDRSFQNYK